MGVASSTHIVRDEHTRRRVSVSSVPDCCWPRLLRPSPKILEQNPHRGRREQQRHKRLFGRRLRLRQGLYDPGGHVRAVGSLGRYDYRGTLFGTGSDLAKTFDGEAGYSAALLGYQFRAQSLPETFRRHRGRGPEDPSSRSTKFGARERRRSQACGRSLARPLTALVPVARRLPWHGVSAILESCRPSVWPAFHSRALRRCAGQSGV